MRLVRRILQYLDNLGDGGLDKDYTYKHADVLLHSSYILNVKPSILLIRAVLPRWLHKYT